MSLEPNPKWWIFENTHTASIVQEEMAQKVVLEDTFSKPIQTIGGMDVSNTPFDPRQRIFGAVTVHSYPTLTLLETATQVNRQTVPYIPGFLGFREVPTLFQAYNKLSLIPDILLVDGHGISHPKGLGVASHIGVLLDVPTIGVAKSILVGEPSGPLPEEAGQSVPLVWKNQIIGMVLRTKKRCAPLLISTGHKICLESAVAIVLQCITRYRLPEPTRSAHNKANLYRKTFA